MPEDEVFDVIETIELVENAHALPQAHALCVEFMLDGLRREGRPDLAEMLALPDGFHRNPSKLR